MNRVAAGDLVNVVGLQKGAELYLLLYEDGAEPEALRQLGRWAEDDQLNFSWHDAAVLSRRVRKLEI